MFYFYNYIPLKENQSFNRLFFFKHDKLIDENQSNDNFSPDKRDNYNCLLKVHEIRPQNYFKNYVTTFEYI